MHDGESARKDLRATQLPGSGCSDGAVSFSGRFGELSMVDGLKDELFAPSISLRMA